MNELDNATGKRFPPIGRCIYCPSTENLSDEHIFPFALGGTAVLPQASCKSCRTITGRFEQEVLRGAMWPVRMFRELQSRTKFSEAPRTRPVTVTDRAGASEVIHVGYADAPVVFSFPLFAVPAFLDPEEYQAGIRLRGLATVGFGSTPESLAATFDARQVRWEADYRYVSFARMLAKIAYASAIAQGGLNLFDGEAYVLPAILGTRDDIGRWVGTLTKPYENHKGRLHRVDFGESKEKDLLMAEVQLFSDSETPSYGIILGQIRRKSTDIGA